MLEIIVSVLYFTNKVFLFLEKRSAWSIGILASSLAIVYFTSLALYIFLALEIACLTIMIYGLIGAKSSKLFSYIVYSTVSIVMLFLLYKIEETGLLEFVTSIAFMLAFLSLAKNKWLAGWTLLGFSHLLMLVVTAQKGEFIFASMQGFSVIVCVLALMKRKKSKLIKEGQYSI